MATTLDIEICKIVNAGNFWARPIGRHGEEIQNVLGKLNDFIRNNSTPQLQPKKGQMCIIQRTSDNCWYRARIKTVLQTLSGPQASVLLVDLAETTLVPCCRIREIPQGFQTIPVQAMECLLAGIQPLGLVTSYFDLKTTKQVTDHWDEAATAFFNTLVEGSKLQVTVQNQDEKGRYHVLLLADSSGHAQVCINDELVLKGFAVYSCDGGTMPGMTTPEISPGVIAKLQAMNEKFQKQGSEVIKNLKEYVSFGKQTSSEESSGTDDELSGYNKHEHLYFDNSPLSVIRRHLPEYNSHGPECNSYRLRQGLLQEPAARIPNENAFDASFRLSPPKLVSEELSDSASGKLLPHRRPANLSIDEAGGRVRFVSARLPATGSSVKSTGLSTSPESKPLKPILKKTSPCSVLQSSGSSTELEDRPQDEYACKPSFPRILGDDSFQGERFVVENNQNCASRKSISADLLFGDLKPDALKLDSCSSFGSDMTGETATAGDIFQREPSHDNTPKRVVSLIESLRDASHERHELSSIDFSQVAGSNRTCSASQKTLAIVDGPSVHASEKEDALSRISVAKSLSGKETHKTASSSPSLSSLKTPLTSELFCVDSSAHSSPGEANVTFTNGVVVHSEGAPAPRPTTSTENCPFTDYLRRLGVSTPSLIQAHAWPALRRGRDVVGISPSNPGRKLAYLLPIINQILDEKQIYAELPSGNGPLLLIMVPSSSEGVEVCRQCTDILARHRNVRVRVAFAGGAEESQILALLNGCDILISTPPCFLRMVKRCYTSLNRLCHVVFDHADIMVEEFTLDIREIMRLYAKVLKSQLCRLAPRQAVVMATSWTVGVASLVKAYLGNPVSVIANMIEAAIYKNVQQIATVCSESQRDVQLLGYLESFSNTKDICVITSTTSEADKIERLLEANAYYTLVAHEFLQPQELDRVSRQWNTPHAADTMPVLVLTDGALSQMNIGNASCVIHYSFPSTKTQFEQRFSVLAATFTSSKDHGCVSIILVTERRFRESPFIRRLIRRSGKEVPSLLNEMAEIAIQDRVKKRKDLCHSLKAFGTCRFKRGTTICYSRHSVLANLDKPLEGIPTSGVVKVLILCVMDASCYWVRLLEHRHTDQCQSSEVANGTKFLELTMAVSGWFSDPNHRVKHELVSVGNLCAVQDGSSFHRVKVCCITETHSAKPLRVEVHYVDRGDFEVVHVNRLLQLPAEFHSCPFQAVQVFLCRVQPLDKDPMWTDQASFFVRRLIEGKEMEGRVVLSLGNTLWLDPLVERAHLMSINMTTNVSNVRMELLKERYAAENKQHVKLLKSLCENVIELPSLELEQIGTGDGSSECSHALETAILPEDRFQDVYVSAVENPGLFFVQLSSSQESLEDLRGKIDSCVGSVEKEACDISIGSLCVAQFTQNDKWYRARVLGSRPENEYDVFYVDFGDREWIPAGRIVPAWSNILRAPLQAIECSLVNVVPIESDWREEDSDAFWEMVSEKRLVAKVQSKCPSLVAGCNRFIVELYDTTTQHDVILSHEVVATGHAQTSAEGLQMLFPQPVSCDDGQLDYQYPFQRIPRMCLEAHQCQDPVKKVEILKELQSVVLNSEGEKDAIRECGGVQGLCRLLSFSATPLVQQHILTSLASLIFENESNCDEVRMFGGLRTMCHLLEKTQNSAVQDSLAWALKNLAISERNQDETREQGGVKCLCKLLLSTSDERVQGRVAWALGSLVKDNDRNCQAVEECGGLRTLCDLVANLQNEDALERATWALAGLGALPRNRNFIRQYGGIENICKKLQESPSEQFVKQGALTLKIMASNNQSNKEAICRLRMIETLQNLMTDNTLRLGIISRRVCWDLLQRLLGPAAGAAQLSSPPMSSVNRSHGCVSSTGGTQNNQEPLAETVNGFAESDEDLPPLGGDDSETENQTDVVVNDARQAARRCNSRGDAQKRTSANASAVGSMCHVVSNGHRSPISEIEVEEPFRTQMGRTLYELDLELFQNVNAERSRMVVKGAEMQILLWKRDHARWPRLLRAKEKLPYVSIDFDRWEVWSSSEEDEGNDDNPNADNRSTPKDANYTRTSRGSETRAENKRVLLPEMVPSSSESSKSDDERMDSDVDRLKFC